ncbi:Anthocyanidin 3-O-glucosyltransferase [Nymphaea thermarum]|nr:Anthocyanidin 3-O-glucosyltransferase [Nymphaea thermarum]
MAMATNDDARSPLRAVMFPWLGFGHIFPFVQLSNRLHANGVDVTFLSPPSLVTKIRTALDPNIPILNYHLPAVKGIPAGVESTFGAPTIMELFLQAADQVRPQIAKLLCQLSPDVVIFDFAYHWIPPLADSLGIKSVYFSIFIAIAMAHSAAPAMLWPGKDFILAALRVIPPRVHAALAGLQLYEARDAGYYLKMHHGSTLSMYGRMVTTMMLSSANAVRSALETESRYAKWYSSLWKKPVLLTGLLVPKPPSGELEARWDQWLSRFPPTSVVFCAFGSETCLPVEQMRELIAGFEMSGSPFLLVLNFPSKEEEELAAAEQLLGEKMGGRGMVQSGWIQQPLILRHPSVGGFVSHCGFSSLVEAVVADCQVVLMPLKADQFLNGKLMAEELKIGVRLERRYSDGWFTRNGVCKAVKTMMMKEEEQTVEIKAMRANHAKFREFLLDEAAQQEYSLNFVAQLRKLVSTPQAGTEAIKAANFTSSFLPIFICAASILFIALIYLRLFS